MTTEPIKKGKAMRLSTALPAPVLLPGGSIGPTDLAAALEDHVRVSLGQRPQHYNRPINLPDRFQAPIDSIVAGRWQPRTVFADPELGDLVESIAAHGVITPLLVFANETAQLELIAGERRLRAARLAGLASVPVQLVDGDPQKLHELSIVDNLQRENLKSWEEGAAFERMIAELGVSEAELARRMGKNRAYIQQRRALASAAPELCQALADESISFGIARGIIAGAGGDLAVQRAGVKAVLTELKAGKPVKEDSARALTAKQVLEVHRATLEGRGWKLCTYLGGISALVVWAPSERPRFLTEKELIDLAASGAAPAAGDGPAPWEEDSDLIVVFRERGISIYAGVLAPWIYLVNSDKGSTKPQITFCSGAEMPAHAKAAQADIDALEERVAALGWKRRRNGSAVQFVKDSQKTTSAWDWRGQLELAAQLEEGRATLVERDSCPQCQRWLDEGPTIYFGGRQVHTACKEAAIAAERQQILAQPAPHTVAAAVEVPNWLQHIPEDALRALVAFLTDGEYADESSLEEIRVEFAAFLETAIQEYRA